VGQAGRRAGGRTNTRALHDRELAIPVPTLSALGCLSWDYELRIGTVVVDADEVDLRLWHCRYLTTGLGGGL